MATTTATPEPLWIFEKAVLVHVPNLDVACAARLRIAHDRNNYLGLVSIRIRLAVDRSGKQNLTLNINPDIVDWCTVYQKSNANLIPDGLFPMLPVSVTDPADVTTLILRLNTTGVVLVPPRAEGAILNPALVGDDLFDAFAKICQSKIIQLHLSKQQLRDGELGQLRKFAGSLRVHVLKTLPLDYKRLNAGQGAIEKDWRIFGQSDLTPYHGCFSAKSVLGKRARDGSPSREQHTASVAACTPPPAWSPTEVITPTTRTSSPPDITPTKFTHKTTQSFRDHLKVLELQQQLTGLTDHLVWKILVGSGHQHLLARTPRAAREKPWKCSGNTPPHPSRASSEDTEVEPVTIAKVDKLIEHRLDEFIEQRLAKLTKDAFKQLTRTRLDTLVEAQLPVAAELVLSGAVANHRDQFYQECQTNELHLREQTDENITEIRDVTENCLTEIQDLGQQCMESLEDLGQTLDASAEHELERLKRWFVELAKGVFNDKKGTSPNGLSGDMKRRNSM